MSGLLEVDDSRPHLIVHIGGAKCGSTAIQDTLFVNRPSLQKMGYAVPDTDFKLSTGRSNQIWFFQNIIGQGPAGTKKATRNLEQRVNAVWASLSDITRGAPRGIILSAENLSNDNGLHEAFRSLKKRFRLSIILYIRRQEDFYHSAWQQWFVKSWPSVDILLERWQADSCDWNGALERWESIEPDSITVRLFDRSLLTGGDVVDDFCGQMGLDITSLRRPAGDTNVTNGVHVSDLYHSMAAIFDGPHDHSLESELHRLGVVAARKQQSAEWLFTREQFDLIRSRHAPGNALVKAKYFPDLSREDLFPAIPETDTFRPPQSELNRRNLGVLGEMSVRQHRETDVKLRSMLDRLDKIEKKIEGQSGAGILQKIKLRLRRGL